MAYARANGRWGLAVAIGLVWCASSMAADEPKPAEPPVPSKVFSANRDVVWDKLVSTFKSFDIGVASADKDGGKLTTVPRRYFKILSAKFPPVQEDYRDTYDVMVDKQDKQTKVEIKRKFEFYDRAKPPNGDWAQPSAIPDKVGISPGEILSALELEIAAAAIPANR